MAERLGNGGATKATTKNARRTERKDNRVLFIQTPREVCGPGGSALQASLRWRAIFNRSRIAVFFTSRQEEIVKYGPIFDRSPKTDSDMRPVS
jgi:hypothetical protein